MRRCIATRADTIFSPLVWECTALRIERHRIQRNYEGQIDPNWVTKVHDPHNRVVRPLSPTVVWICDNEKCGEGMVAVGSHHGPRSHYRGGKLIDHDTRICPGCGAMRNPYAILAMVEVVVEPPEKMD